jgi:SET domain-containing protein
VNSVLNYWLHKKERSIEYSVCHHGIIPTAFERETGKILRIIQFKINTM